MTYTVAEAERILAEAKAREAAVDPLLIEAREVCARFYEADGSPTLAAEHRAGKFDDGDSQQTIALAALRRGMELAQPSPAPRIAAMEAAAEALEDAANTFADYAELHSAKGTEEGRAKARRNITKAETMRTALTQLTAQSEAARKGE